MTERILTCIVCPMGCTLTAKLDPSGSVTEVRGNTCPRGDQYARKECVAPERTVTGTVRLTGGALAVLPVRTAGPVPKEQVLAVADALRRLSVTVTVHTGDTICEDIAGTGVALIATRTVA